MTRPGGGNIFFSHESIYLFSIINYKNKKQKNKKQNNKKQKENLRENGKKELKYS